MTKNVAWATIMDFLKISYWPEIDQTLTKSKF